MSDLSNVRLVTCVGVERELPLLGHFLDHYTALGIDPAHLGRGDADEFGAVRDP